MNDIRHLLATEDSIEDMTAKQLQTRAREFGHSAQMHHIYRINVKVQDKLKKIIKTMVADGIDKEEIRGFVNSLLD